LKEQNNIINLEENKMCSANRQRLELQRKLSASKLAESRQDLPSLALSRFRKGETQISELDPSAESSDMQPQPKKAQHNIEILRGKRSVPRVDKDLNLEGSHRYPQRHQMHYRIQTNWLERT